MNPTVAHTLSVPRRYSCRRMASIRRDSQEHQTQNTTLSPSSGRLWSRTKMQKTQERTQCHFPTMSNTVKRSALILVFLVACATFEPMPAASSDQSPTTNHLPPLLDFHHISVMRGHKTVLENITLRIRAGEHVAILGPNGCGKSTLIKTITRECYPLARPGSSLSILGQTSWNVFELRTMLGIVSSDLMSTCTRDITGLEV